MSLIVTALVKIDPQLRHWIENNLDRGCPPEQLIEGMIARRFDPPIAQGLVRAFVDARTAGVPLTADTLSIDVPGGGETTFPHAGLSVCPRQGNAVYFEYCNSRGQVDAASLHAGAPVTEGEKWAVTKWMRERRFVPAGAQSP